MNYTLYQNMLISLLCLYSSTLQSMERIRENKKAYALNVVPQLKCMLPVELESFLNAYGQFFDDLNELFDAQGEGGNTLLHRVIMLTDNTELFCYLLKVGAATDIPNNQGITVAQLIVINPLFKDLSKKVIKGDIEADPQGKQSPEEPLGREQKASPPAKKRVRIGRVENHEAISLSDVSLAKQKQ